MPSVLRTDILPRELSQEPDRIVVRQQFDQVLSGARKRSEESRTTPEPAKNLIESIDLIRKVLADKENRLGIAQKDRVAFTEEYPDFNTETELIVFSIGKSLPGAFGEGRPFESDIKNLVPALRQEIEDPENPGYKMAILGYWMDHMVKLTCFARTNKAANRRVLWVQDVLREYSWYLRWSGIGRVFFMGREEDFILEEKEQKLYARPLNYFVRTEEITQLRERTLEQLIIDSGQVNSTSVLTRTLR